MKRVVVTSSYASALNLDEGEFVERTYTENDWTPFTLESATQPGQNGGYIYSASKTLAEKAAWDYANANELELATILPPMIYGPPLQPVPSKDKLNASSSAIYVLIDGDKGRPVPQNIWIHNVAVEDAALAHVRAAEREGAKGHRFLIGGNTMLWEDVSNPRQAFDLVRVNGLTFLALFRLCCTSGTSGPSWLSGSLPCPRSQRTTAR